jgi:hypothetical protein
VALYLISYDINEEDGFDYDGLWDRLKKLGAVRILYSEWVMEDGIGQAGTIYHEIAPKVQEKDRLLVQEVADDAAWDKLLIPDRVFNKLLNAARA